MRIVLKIVALAVLLSACTQRQPQPLPVVRTTRPMRIIVADRPPASCGNGDLFIEKSTRRIFGCTSRYVFERSPLEWK